MTDPVLEALWKRVVDDFGEDSSHEAFIEHCRLTNQLLEAAVRYRGMAGDHARGAQAQKRLGAIATLALAQLETQRSPARPDLAQALRLILILLFIVGSAALLFMR